MDDHILAIYVDFTPGRPFVKPSVRRTSAVKGVPRSRWLKSLGVHDQRVAWLKPKTCPSWLTREALAALPETLMLREVRYHIGRPGFRTRQITLVTTLLDAAIYRVADLAELYRQRWQVEVCQTQPIKMPWCPLRLFRQTLSHLRGGFKREHVLDVNRFSRDDDCADQALGDSLTFFKRELFKVMAQ
jgi:hypothetical protein